MTSSNRNTTALPQGFSIYQPALGAPLQFLPAVGTAELDELISAYVPGNACSQEKRASVSLDFLEYSHVTGQTFKFYPVYSMSTPVESPATDSGYGSSFNVSPVASSWDFSQIHSSRSPASSHQTRLSPKASSRHQTADFSNLPGMKIMTKDGRDVTNSASRGSKTKEQRDHAHLMRIIKACDSCRRKKIRCDPSHKKRAVSQSQSTAKSTRKSKAVAQAVQAAASTSQPVDVSLPASGMTTDRSIVPVDLESFAPSLPALEPWEEFIEYPPVDLAADYDFFYDPEGYFSPESFSSSGLALSTKPVTPTSQQDTAASYSLQDGESVAASSQLPFNQTESIHDYVDFNLFSPESSFSEDDNMVAIEMSRHLSHQSQYNPHQDHSPGGSDPDSGIIGNASDSTSWSLSPRQSGEDELAIYNIYRDPGAGGGVDHRFSSSSLSSNMPSQSTGMITETSHPSIDQTDTFNHIDNVNGTFARDSVEASHIDRVSTISGIGEPLAPNAPRVGANILNDDVVANSHAAHILASSESSSRVDAHVGHSRNGRITATDINPATHDNVQSVVITAAPGFETDIGFSTTLTGTSAYAISIEQVNITSATDSATAIIANASASSPLAFVDTISQTLNEHTALSSDGSAIATYSVTSSEAESSVSRGTEASASVIRNVKSFATSLIENAIVDSNDLGGEAATASYDKYGPKKNTLSQPSARPNVSDHSMGICRTKAQLKNWCTPRPSTDGGDCTSIGFSMTGALLFLAAGAHGLFTEQHMASMIIIMLSLLLVMRQFIQLSNALVCVSHETHSMIREILVKKNRTSIKARLWNRFGTLESHASLGTLSVNQTLLRGAGLLTM